MINDGINQPLTIKIQWSTCTGHKMSCDVTLDKGHFGPKYVLGYTILDFTTKPLMQWEKDNPGDEVYVKKMFDLFRIFLLRLAANTWDLCAAKFEEDKHTEKNFMRCMKDYLEAVSKCTNLSNQIHLLALS